MYLGGGLVFTAAAAVAVFRTPALIRLVSGGSMMVSLDY